MQPIDYINPQRIATNPIANLVMGLKTGSMIQDLRANREANARLDAMKTDLSALGPYASADDMLKFREKYPEMQKIYEPIFSGMNENQKQSELSGASQAYSAIMSGNTEVAGQILDEHIKAAENAGQSTSKLEQLREALTKNPEGVAKHLNMFLAMGMDPQKYKNFMEANSPSTEQAFQPLTKDQAASLGLSTENAYQIQSNGKITQIGGKGVTVNVGDKFPKPTAGYDYVRNERGDPVVDENGQLQQYAIKGSKPYLEQQEKKQQEKERWEAAVQTSRIVTDTGNQLLKMLDNESMLNPVTGPTGELVGALPFIRAGSARTTAESLISTLKSNIAFKTLMDMKSASPTGGALGAVSEKELHLLESNLASLDLAQNPEMLKKNIKKVMAIYGNIFKKIDKKKFAEEQVSFGERQSEARPERSPVESRITPDGKTITKFSDGTFEVK